MRAEATGGHLVVQGLNKSFGGLRALHDVSLEVGRGELVGLIGPNGSGKTTAIDCLTGFLKPDALAATFDGEPIAGRRPDQLADVGLVRTFQQVRVFPTLSVRRNISMGGWAQTRGGPKRDWRDIDERTEELVDMLGLRRLADSPTSRLSYGQRKLVEFAAGLQCRPKLLLLDEPVAAVNPTLANAMRDRILEINASGVSVLLVEHNMELVTDICHRLVVLDHGEKIADGSPSDVMARRDVQEAYFGR
jgi:branched-chain amino acid transport system ATP-binding protein